MKSEGGEFAGSCSSDPPDPCQSRTALLPSADANRADLSLPACATACGGDAAHSPRTRHWDELCSGLPLPFHRPPSGSAAQEQLLTGLERVSPLTGEKHGSLLCLQPRAPRPAHLNAHLPGADAGLHHGRGLRVQLWPPQIYLCPENKCRVVLNAVPSLPLLPTPRGCRQPTDYQNYCDFYFFFLPDTDIWNFKASDPAGPRLGAATVLCQQHEL